MKPLFACSLLALTVAACATGGSTPGPLTHAAIAQAGAELRPAGSSGGVYEYRLQKGPFALRVPNRDAAGGAHDPERVIIQVCASTDPTMFQDIAPGREVAGMRCLNDAVIMARDPEETPAGVDLMLSKGDGQNVFDAKLSIPGPLYDTVNVQQVMDFKVVGKFCMAPNNTRCIDEHAMQPFGAGTVYLIVFTDLNEDHVVEAGEYTLLKLDLPG